MSDVESTSSHVSGDEETEILVYVELDGCIDSSVFRNEKLQFHMVGIDSDSPVMQINGKFYQGTYKDAVGTYMFFERDKAPLVDDPVFDTVPTWKYVTKTRKLLTMERVFAIPRTELLGDSGGTDCIPNLETIKEAGVPPAYQEDALNLWNTIRNDRMQALNEYLEKQQIREEKRLQGIQLESESDEDHPFAMYKPGKEVGMLQVSEDDDNDNFDEQILENSKTTEETTDPSQDVNSATHSPTTPQSVVSPDVAESSVDTPTSSSKKISGASVGKATVESTSEDNLQPSIKPLPQREHISDQASTSVEGTGQIALAIAELDSTQRSSVKKHQSSLPDDVGGVSDPEIPTATYQLSKKLDQQAESEVKVTDVSNELQKHENELLPVKTPESKDP